MKNLFLFILIVIFICPLFAEKERSNEILGENGTPKNENAQNQNEVEQKKILVVYYSRTGNTRKVAELISEHLDCDIEEIWDKKDRSGAWGYMQSGYDATFKRLADIGEIKNDPANYDLVIIGTPVWAGTMSSPIRTYITRNNAKFNDIAFFCTMGGSGDMRTFRAMEELAGKHPKATLSITEREIKNISYERKLNEFITVVKKLNK